MSALIPIAEVGKPTEAQWMLSLAAGTSLCGPHTFMGSLSWQYENSALASPKTRLAVSPPNAAAQQGLPRGMESARRFGRLAAAVMTLRSR